jgi:DNA-binding transcriptional MerR regulator
MYPASAIERVLAVRKALRIGFSLAELAEVLKTRDAGGVPCRRVYELAQEKLNRISDDIKALRETERYLRRVLSEWESRLHEAGPGEKSHLLYSLSKAPLRHAVVKRLRGRKAQ